MPEYVVSWTIDIDAESPREAAQDALRIQRDAASTATVFCVREVIERRGVTTSIVGPTSEIDLSEAPAIEQARELGRQAGRDAGSWAADGNTPTEHIRKVLAMLDDGDPAAYDFLPRRPNLSGEYADDPTPHSIASGLLGNDQAPEDRDALADAWEDGVSETFEAECERTLRGLLPADDVPAEGESA